MLLIWGLIDSAGKYFKYKVHTILFSFCAWYTAWIHERKAGLSFFDAADVIRPLINVLVLGRYTSKGHGGWRAASNTWRLPRPFRHLGNLSGAHAALFLDLGRRHFPTGGPYYLLQSDPFLLCFPLRVSLRVLCITSEQMLHYT